jgi:hypothetical protein
MVSLPLRSVSFPLAGWSEAVEVEQAVELHETHRFRPQLEPTTLSARHNEKSMTLFLPQRGVLRGRRTPRTRS